jgi:D-threonate/D-erythronate kinase
VIHFMIADDLTGAADASVHFAGRRPVEIAISNSITLPTLWGVPGWGRGQARKLRVLDSETRESAPSQAASFVIRACQGLSEGVFKKVDSTLRGPVAAELEATRVALGRSTAVLAPSLPAQGRVVTSGRLQVDGSDVGAVAEIIGAAAVSLPVERLGSGPLPDLVVIDATTDADLDLVAAACAIRPDILPAGSAGLAAAFARLEGSAAPVSVPVSRRVLVVVASRHAAARAQLAWLRANPHPAIEVRAVPEDAAGEPWELATGLGRQALDWLEDPLPGFAGTPPPGGGETFPMTILATGGDAALAVCRALGIASIRPRVEVLPGVVWSETGRDGLALATKAGGFGGPRLLLDAALKLLAVDSDG